MATLDGQQVGPYQIIGQMGSGGMATVYKAYHARLDRHVAIKVMHEAFQQDASFLARFEREAQIVARLEHPNIVPIYDFADLDGRPYLVMKYIQGNTLKARMLRNPPTLADIQRILPPIANALDYAHRQGILHRDIKPSNIVLDANGIPHLTDFGLARIAQLGESTLSQDSVLGTPQYISPEQAMGKRDLTPATDLYSLGVVLYEMIVGRVPFSSDTPFATIHDHIYRALPLPSEINPELTPEIDAVLERALLKRSEDRYPTAGELVSAFLSAVEASNLHTLNPDRSQIAAKAMHDRPREDVYDHERTTPLPRSDAKPSQTSGTPEPRKPKTEITFDLNNLSNVDWGGVGQKIEKAIQVVGVQIEQAFDGKPEDEMLSSNPEIIRERIQQQFKKRMEFFSHLGIFVLVNVVVWIIFLFTGERAASVGGAENLFLNAFPWPLIMFFGWGAGVLAHGVETLYDTGDRLQRQIEAVHRELVATYGEDWRRVATKKKIKQVREKVEKPIKKVREFYEHLVVYISINIMLWLIFLSNDYERMATGGFGALFQFTSFPWPLVVNLIWGAMLFGHASEALNFRQSEKAIQREVEREQMRMLAREKPKREAYDVSVIEPPRVRINDDGEFTDSMIEEIAAQKSRRG